MPSGGLNEDAEFSINAGEVTFDDISKNESLRSKLSHNIEYLSNWLEKKVDESLKDNRIFLLFDKLDEAWDTNSIEVCKNINTGLIIASDYITQKYKGQLRPILFLREDIFETLSLNDKTKLREDCGALLKWDKDLLHKMILSRINHHASTHGIQTIHDLNEIFDRKELRSRATPLNYIIRSSFMRPRDIICFMKNIIDLMKEEKNNLESEDTESENFEYISTSSQLIADMIYNAEPAYSEWLKNELKDEWQTQKPELLNFLNIITNLGKTVISMDEFRLKYSETLGEIDQAALLSIMNFLFDNSIIGFKIGESTIWRFKCTYPAQGFTVTQSYRVHFGLTKSLNLTETYLQD